MREPGPATELATPPSPDGPDASGEDPTDLTRAWPRRRVAVLLLVLVVVVAIPLVVAVGVLREPRWYPTSDIAQTELKVRDVGTANPPLTGLGGRIGPDGEGVGSHPGPLSFWSLAVVYNLLGATSAGLQAAAAALNVVALGLLVWMAQRRGGPAAMVAMTAVLLVLITAYGFYALTVPWNPYMPMLWWVVAMVAVWSLLCGDLPMLPVAVFATSFCVQTHISYLGLGGVVALTGAAACAYWVWARRDDRPRLRASLRWVAIGSALGALLWFPPIAEQVTGSQGHNLSVIYDHFGNPPEEPVGLRSGADVVLGTLNPRMLLTEPVIDGRIFIAGPIAPGILLLVTWLAAVGVAWRLRHGILLRLHALLAVVLAVGVVSAARIFGPLFGYLALWGWGIGALLVLAVAWSFGALGMQLLATRERSAAGSRLVPVGAVVATVVVVALATRATVDAADAEDFRAELRERAAVLVPDTVDALADGSAPGTGRDGRYLVSSSDSWYGGAGGFTLFNELDREGFDVGNPPTLQYAFTRHRVLDAGEATAEIHLAVGPDIDVWAARPDARRLAHFDPAGPDGRAEYERLEALVVTELRANGAPDADDFVNVNPFAFPFRTDLSEPGKQRVRRLIELGRASAVFVAPPPPAG